MPKATRRNKIVKKYIYTHGQCTATVSWSRRNLGGRCLNGCLEGESLCGSHFTKSKRLMGDTPAPVVVTGVEAIAEAVKQTSEALCIPELIQQLINYSNKNGKEFTLHCVRRPVDRLVIDLVV